MYLLCVDKISCLIILIQCYESFHILFLYKLLINNTRNHCFEVFKMFYIDQYITQALSNATIFIEIVLMVQVVIQVVLIWGM